ncbi:hypothetical protein UCRNP2_507 [Neofusicoccum parvum UCRNP2]|uniref:Uncharacterized protein n=1 Tax=Botryosphaeria parva (strain UCR-NP2) TaxID=1287680 RepID=R1EYI7_BOTPV|nr:hypothetical protein UCRNP2_507 [Neofusicoccum parvum UCRNP2]
MTAITSIPNPLDAENFFLFYNDQEQQLAADQMPWSETRKTKLRLGSVPASCPTTEPPSTDPSAGRGGAEFSSSDIPPGDLANPSAITSVLFHKMVNVYGVVNGKSNKLLVCRLSPGFHQLKTGTAPLASARGIAACSDGDSKGTLFFTISQNNETLLKSLPLPGTHSSSHTVPAPGPIHPQTYLGAAYGKLGSSSSPDAFVAMQDNHDHIHVFSQHEELSGRIKDSAMKTTPIACVFVGSTLLVYYLGPVGTGSSTSYPPLRRAVAGKGGLGDIHSEILDDAPTPAVLTQLAALAVEGAGGGGGGEGKMVELMYVQAEENELVSWVDPLENVDV